MGLDVERLRREAEDRVRQLERWARTADDLERVARVRLLIERALECRLRAMEAREAFERLRRHAHARRPPAAKGQCPG